MAQPPRTDQPLQRKEKDIAVEDLVKKKAAEKAAAEKKKAEVEAKASAKQRPREFQFDKGLFIYCISYKTEKVYMQLCI